MKKREGPNAAAEGEVAGDPAFLTTAFLNLTRGTSDPEASVRLFLDGARPAG